MEIEDYLNEDEMRANTKMVNRIKDINDDIQRLNDKGDSFTAADDIEMTELVTEFEELEAQHQKLHRSAQARKISVSAKKPGAVHRGDTRELDDDPFTEPTENRGVFNDPWALDEMRAYPLDGGGRAVELRTRALSAIEQMSGTNDQTRESMTNIIETWDNENSDLAKQALLTSSPAYMRAFVKNAKGREGAMTTDEQQAVQRAMSLTTTEGGFMIPFQLDPTVIITSAGSFNQVRQMSRQVIATGNVWNGVSAGATAWSWASEATEVSDDASTFAQPSITVHRGEGFIPISLEALQDEANVAQEVGRLLAFGKDTLESTSFVTGTGSGQPFGIITALQGVAGSVVDVVTTDTYGLPDLYALDGDLPARYRQNASWLAHRLTYNATRQFDTSGGAALWVQLGSDVPPQLLGRPAYEAEAMDGVIATTDDYILCYGQFSEYYVIADRIGTTVEFVPQIFGASGYPTGQKGWFAWFRAGADSTNDDAFRLLNAT